MCQDNDFSGRFPSCEKDLLKETNHLEASVLTPFMSLLEPKTHASHRLVKREAVFGKTELMLTIRSNP